MPNARPECRYQAPQPRSGAPKAQGCSGAAAAAQSAMLSIAAYSRTDCYHVSTGAADFMAPQLQFRISTSLTDVTRAGRNDAPA